MNVIGKAVAIVGTSHLRSRAKWC